MSQNLDFLIEELSEGITEAEIKEIIRKENTDMRYCEEGHFFIYDYEGNAISQPKNRDKKGKIRWDYQDP